MKYPLIKKNKNTYPEKAICPICKKEKVFEPHNFICLSGGTLKVNKDNSYSSLDNNKFFGYLDLMWHGHHYKNKNDSKKDTGFILPIVDKSKSGCFDLYFCSINCLRKFFNNIVDDFEKNLNKIIRE